MSNYLVTFYTKPDGSKPVSEFIQSLEPKMQAKVIRSLEILEANGPTLREPYTKALGDGIFELRIQAAGNISRVLYFYVLGHTIIATHGFIKKTRKTPPAELRLAKTYRADYMRRMKEEHT